MKNDSRQKEGLVPRVKALDAILNWKTNKTFVLENLQKICDGLPQNDRSLAYEIAMGTCRALGDIDEKLASLMKKLPPEPCKSILEISLYQLLYMRIPAYAAIDSAVEIAKKKSGKSEAKFVNAVLRNAVRKKFPQVLENKAPPQWLRANPQKTNADELVAKLGLQGAKILFDKFISVQNAGEVLKNPLFEKGFYSFQNPASFFVQKMCKIKSGFKIWDACAAPGGKTAMLAEENPDAFFVSTDFSERRITKLFDLQNRLNLKNVHIALADAQNPPFSLCFDIVIIDAPCSNMGVANRRPEVLQSFSKEKISELAKKQFAILCGVSSVVKADGIIVYSVCSHEKEETEEVVKKFLANNSGFIQEDFIFTDMPDADKFFVAKLRRA